MATKDKLEALPINIGKAFSLKTCIILLGQQGTPKMVAKSQSMEKNKQPVELNLQTEGYYMVEEPSLSLWCSFSLIGPHRSFSLSLWAALRRAADWFFFFQFLSVDFNFDSS